MQRVLFACLNQPAGCLWSSVLTWGWNWFTLTCKKITHFMFQLSVCACFMQLPQWTIKQVGALYVHLFPSAYTEWKKTQFCIKCHTLDLQSQLSSACKSSILSPTLISLNNMPASLIAIATYSLSSPNSQWRFDVYTVKKKNLRQGFLVSYLFTSMWQFTEWNQELILIFPETDCKISSRSDKINNIVNITEKKMYQVNFQFIKALN